MTLCIDIMLPDGVQLMPLDVRVLAPGPTDGPAPPAGCSSSPPAGTGAPPETYAQHVQLLAGTVRDLLRQDGIENPDWLLRRYGADRILDVMNMMDRQLKPVHNRAAYIIAALTRGYTVPG